MSIQILVPDLGESVIEATVLRWLKQEGEQVAAGETVVELETEKVNLDVTAPGAGVLSRIAHEQGDDVRIGDVLGEINPVTFPASQPSPAAPTPSPLSSSGEMPVVRDTSNANPTPTPPPLSPSGEGPGVRDATEIKATPIAERLARESGVDLRQVKPASPDQRITKQDVESYLEKQKGQTTDGGQRTADRESQMANRESPTTQPPDKPTIRPSDQPTIRPTNHPTIRPSDHPTTEPPISNRDALYRTNPPSDALDHTNRQERVRMSRRRQTIARRLVEAQQTAAMLTTFNEVDMSAVMDIRKRHKESFKQRHGVSLGLTSFFVPAVVGALKAFPPLNAEIQGDEIVYKHHYDIGIAVGAEDGLVVPVIRDADMLSFPEIEKQIHAFGEKAQSGALSLNDLRGGTFTITNGGVYGSLLSTPILNPPQVGILGLHTIKERPIASQGQIVIRPMMYIALSYDHRLVDGRQAVQFLVRIKELIEDPAALLLE